MLTVAAAQAADRLPSWNDTAPKRAIVSFVEKVTKEGSPDFVPPAERIAVFDNDGRLWSEQPMYFQLAFAIDRVKALAPQHPEWKEKEPFKSVLAGDLKGLAAGGEHALLELVLASHTGNTTEEFEQVVRDWIATAKHAKTGRLYKEMVFQPMLELLEYLRANGFKAYIVSGGGIEFMRAWVEDVYGVPPEQVIGSSVRPALCCATGQPVLEACRKSTLSTTRQASPSPSTNSSVAARSWPLATPMATCKCSGGRPPVRARVSASTSTIQTRNASSPTIASPHSAGSTRASRRLEARAGRLSTWRTTGSKSFRQLPNQSLR
jgi:hypothetical protein